MIPEQLVITNFLSYRQASVDLTGVHVACLSGENGAGKSALLDSITWALWGAARTRQDDALVHLGEKEMQVELTFRLGSDRYRVVRQRLKGKRSVLDFQVHDGTRWRSLAEHTIRATQAKINRTLRLDYDTFVNSAFLRQGRADEFTIKRPAERKRVLGEILGLDRWKEFEERVRQRQRAVKGETKTLDIRLQEIEEELANRPQYEAQLEAAQGEVNRLGKMLREVREDWQAAEAARTALRHARTQIEELAQRISQEREERQRLAREMEEQKGLLREYQKLLDQADEIEAGFAAYQKAQEQERALGEKLTVQAELNEKRNALEAQITQARHELETRRELAAQHVAELEGRIPPPELAREYDEIQAQLAHLAQLRAGQEAAREDMARLVEERAALQSENKGLRAEMDDLKERIDRLREARANCPLCGQPLTDEDRERLLEELEAEGRRKGETYRANQARLEEVSASTAALETQIANSARLLQGLPDLERRAAELAERQRAGAEAAAALDAARTELTRWEKELAKESFAPDAREELARVLAQAAELGYDPQAHKAARRAVAEGEQFASRKAQLDAARENAGRARNELARLEETARRREEQERADLARREELEKRISSLEKEAARVEAVEKEMARLEIAEAEARQRLGAAQQRLAACDALAQQYETRRQRREELARLEAIYDDLRTAFGVHGVPAMIIEAAIPEIEEEANRLLSQMTNGRMHVRLETQRETQAGKTVETLEIRIMDEWGERPYENYSGGEKFRVNFALRVALSRLLARRAGAQLETLIIDEGFGTQDAQGRTRLVEAIRAVQEEFALVLVITHIEELVEAFPVQVLVTKTAEGSAVQIV